MGNLAVYGAMGLVKSFTKTKNIGELTTGFRDTISEGRESLEVRDSTGIKDFNKVVF